MAISFDKSRQMYVVRVSVNGRRNFIGRYKLEKEAEKAERDYNRKLAYGRDQTLETFKLAYEAQDISLNIFQRLRKIVEKRRAARKLEREVRDALDKQL